MPDKKEIHISCGLPIQHYPKVLLAHGSGGTLMQQLIEQVFKKSFSNPALDKGHDGSIIEIDGTRLAMTTDSYVVDPLFFPGGDIGSLAIHGTVNDLAMCGAKPLAISAGFILEEGIDMQTLERVVQSMKNACEGIGVSIITGDTKVVDKGKGDGIFINTTGLGIVSHKLNIDPGSIKKGDVIILNGDIGRHGMAIMSVRQGLQFETQIESDSAPLWDIVSQVIASQADIHCLRDLTRGGLSSGLVEIAQKACLQITINEKDIPIRPDVRGACEVLGLDPLYVANEGRFICFVKKEDADKVLQILRAHPLGKDACPIGFVSDEQAGLVVMRSRIGTMRIVDMLSGEQLPRIC